ncbi:MAG TPA: FAD-dependent oxidoreductase [Candidatus Saccharimonadia bacterium]
MARATQPGSATVGRRVVVVGGGFGGVRATAQLAGHHGLHVTLISNHHTFAYYPQFYHSATGGSRAEVAIKLGSIFRRRPVHLVHDTITTLDALAHTVTGTSGATYEYDYLVLALGSVTNYFGIDGLEEYSYDIKTIDGAEHFKRHLHRELLDSRGETRHFAVVGGGPTGVELSAAIGHYLRRIARQHRLPAPPIHVHLVEAAPRLLPRAEADFAARVQRQLERLGVSILTNAMVKSETMRALNLPDRTIRTETVVWTAGAANNPFYQANAASFTLNKAGRVVVDDHLLAAPHVYVLGDNADTPFSGYAQTAIRDANFAAQDIWRTVRGHPRPAYRPVKPVNVIPVGQHWAAAEWGPFRVYGYLGYLLRRAADLIGYADVERWPAALRVWLQDGAHANGCRICAQTPGPRV